jgi:glycosyltransferase involved in cell wall biosynthesis
VAAQTFENFEVIVVDDGTRERAERVVQEFHDRRFRYIQHEHGRGGGAARNTGIRNSHAAYIAFLDDDDEWMPQKLEIQYHAFSACSPQVGFSATNREYRSERGVVRSNIPCGVYDFSVRALVQFNQFTTSALMVRASVFRDVGVFDESFPSHQETDLVVRMSERYLVLGIPDALTVQYSEIGVEHIGGNISKRIAGREKFIKKHTWRYRTHADYLAFLYFTLALFYRTAGEHQSALAHFRAAFRIHPTPRYFLHSVVPPSVFVWAREWMRGVSA